MDQTRIVPPELPSVVLARDVPQRQLRAALASGAVERIRPGAYLPRAEVEQTPWQRRERKALARVVAVSRQLPSGVVQSYSHAALVHGLWLLGIDDEVHVTQRTKTGGPRSPGVYRHHDSLPEEHITVVNGLRVTTIERTIVDCARRLHPRDGLAVADSGLRALLNPHRSAPEQIAGRVAELRAELLAMVESGPPRGRRRARVVLAHADPFAESAPESVLRWIALAHGLPRPMLQARVTTRLGTYYADLGWEIEVREPAGAIVTWLVLLEYDGAIKYVPMATTGGTVRDLDVRAVSHAVVAEKRREDAIREEPRTVIRRFQWADLRDVRQAFDRICEAFPPGALPTLQPVPELLGGFAHPSDLGRDA